MKHPKKETAPAGHSSQPGQCSRFHIAANWVNRLNRWQTVAPVLCMLMERHNATKMTPFEIEIDQVEKSLSPSEKMAK
jgi:hypothetical protein